MSTLNHKLVGPTRKIAFPRFFLFLANLFFYVKKQTIFHVKLLALCRRTLVVSLLNTVWKMVCLSLCFFSSFVGKGYAEKSQPTTTVGGELKRGAQDELVARFMSDFFPKSNNLSKLEENLQKFNCQPSPSSLHLNWCHTTKLLVLRFFWSRTKCNVIFKMELFLASWTILIADSTTLVIKTEKALE